MKRVLLAAMCLVCAARMSGAETEKEAAYLALLHKLQYVESYEDLKALLPDLPLPKPDAGEHNTEVIIKTKLFGFDAEGEFNFHKNILVSHGFTVKAPTYKDAHHVFLVAVGLLDEQVDGLQPLVEFPRRGFGGKDPSDGPEDELVIYLNGIHKDASFQLRLSLRSESTVVAWGAQAITR